MGGAYAVGVTAAGRSGIRLVTVVLLCLGLVAMHQAGGGHHQVVGPTTAAAPGMPAATMRGDALAQVAGPVGHLRRAADQGLPVLTAAMAHPAAGGCLAVLLALLVLGLRGTRLLLPPASPAGLLPPRHGTGPLGRGPPRLLLAQLCVLRT